MNTNRNGYANSPPPIGDTWSVGVTSPAGAIFAQTGTTSNTVIGYPNECGGTSDSPTLPPGPNIPGTATTYRERVNISALTANGPITVDFAAQDVTGATLTVIPKVALVYVDVDATFDPAVPVDDYGKFVPGSSLNGKSIDHGIMDGGGQRIKLHVLSAPGISGTIAFSFDQSVTRYPGVAMNYPITQASLLADYSFVDNRYEEHLSTTVPFHASGHTTVILFVRDYAASGRLKVQYTLDGTTRTIFNKLLPKDATGNGMPDHGWKALVSSASNATTPIADIFDPASDDDNDPVSGGFPVQGILGDGLSAGEEYRGFVVRNKHRRLNPSRKDLFAFIDPVDDAIDNRLTELPLTLHELRRSNAVGNNSPVINPNRGSIAGATLQRALRVRNRYPSPDLIRLDGTRVAADFKYRGWTFQRGDNTSVIDELYASMGGNPQSPNETWAAALFDDDFTTHYISYGPDGILSTNVAQPDFDDSIGVVWGTVPLPNGQLGTPDVLQSFPSGDDHHTTLLSTVCGPNPPTNQWRALTVSEVISMYEEVFLHETGHGLHIPHDLTPCTPSLMTTEAALPVGRPLTATDISHIRLHLKHN